MKLQHHLTTDTYIQEYDNGSVIYYDSISDPFKCVIEAYYLRNYNNTAFLCTPCYPYFSFNGNFIDPNVLQKYDNVIFVNFDHLQFENYRNNLFNWLSQINVTKIWEWQIPIMNMYPEHLRSRVEFMPLRYIPSYEEHVIKTSPDPRYLFAFCGTLSQRRINILQYFATNYVPFKVIQGIRYTQCSCEFDGCCCVLNIHGDEGNFQEQLRISEFLSLNIPVVSEVSEINYFGDLVKEFEYDDLRNLEFLYNPINNVALRYKQLTYKDEDFERYRQQLLRYHRVL